MPEAPVPDTYVLNITEVKHHPFIIPNNEIPLIGFELKGLLPSASASPVSRNRVAKFEGAKIKMQLLPDLNATWNSLMVTGKIIPSLSINIYNGRSIKYQIQFTNVLVQSISTFLDSSIIIDEVLIHFTKIKWLAKGRSLGWDLESNKLL